MAVHGVVAWLGSRPDPSLFNPVSGDDGLGIGCSQAVHPVEDVHGYPRLRPLRLRALVHGSV